MKLDMEERMLDLLCKKAVFGLDEGEKKQLSELQKSVGSGFDPESFELATAAIGTVGLDTKAELPANLRSRIVADAERFFDERDAAGSAAANGNAAETIPTSKIKGFSLPAWLGWAVAAAASIVLAINVFTARQEGGQRAGITPPAPTVARELTASEMRQQLIETAPDLAKAKIGPGNIKDVKPTGDVVWSDAQQAGYVRLSGLPVNDANRETYQLWIVAENQDPKTPVDGGVFNVNSAGEVIIPVDPRVRVSNPKAFAITVEKPGGVVVSKQEKVAALAKRET